MQWDELVANLSYYCQQEQPDPSFTAATPRFVDNAELRCYRDIDFAALGAIDYTLACTAGSNLIDLTHMAGQPIGGSPAASVYPVVVESLAAKVSNRWVFFQLASRDWIDTCWPDTSESTAPSAGFAYYTMLDDRTVLLAPVPEYAYPLRVAGTWRPAPMSASNPRTWLGDTCADLLFAAAMVEALGYQRAFGAQADDPRSALSWERQYQGAKERVMREEALRQGLGPGYQPYAPAPLVGPAPNAGPLPPPPGGQGG